MSSRTTPQFRKIAQTIRDALATQDLVVVDVSGKTATGNIVNLASEDRILVLQEPSAKAITRWLWSIKRWRWGRIVWAARCREGSLLGWGSQPSLSAMIRCWRRFPGSCMTQEPALAGSE